MIKGLPRPAIAGSARPAPASANLRINGIGLISLFIGENAGDHHPPLNFQWERARGNRRSGSRTLGRRQCITQGKCLLAQSCFW